MINHTPDAFSAEHPLKDGVIADYDVTEAMISAFINKAAERKYPWQPKPRIVVCIPCGADVPLGEAFLYRTLPCMLYDCVIGLLLYPIAARVMVDRPRVQPGTPVLR